MKAKIRNLIRNIKTSKYTPNFLYWKLEWIEDLFI